MDEGTKPTESWAQSHIIKRPRLTELLDDSGARLILLVAPAGYGKTTLARQWLAAYQRPVAWYRATPASADVAALATGLAAEIDAAIADGETATTDRMTSLVAVQQRPGVLARALSRSREAWPKRLVIAIDDYHQVSSSEAAETFVGELVSLMPATFVITTRTRPIWCTPRQAVYGESVEVGTAELTMTEPEARQVFAASSGKSPRASTLEIARGWPVVIALAARSGRINFPSKALPRNLYEFLAEDLIKATTPETRHTLTVLALTGTNERALIRELVGVDAEVALGEAERRGLLTFESAARVTLHPLLAEFLIARLVEFDQSATTDIVDSLIGVLRDRHRWDECLAVAEAVPCASGSAASVIEDSLEELLSSGRVTTVQRWVAVARSIPLLDPIVELAEAEVALRAGEYERALALGSRAASLLSSQDLRSRAHLVAGRAAHLSDQQPEAQRWFLAAEAAAESPRVRAEAAWGQFIGLVEVEAREDELESALERFAATTNGTVDDQLRLAIGRLMLGSMAGKTVVAVREVQIVQALAPLSVDPLVRLGSLNQVAWALLYGALYEEALAVAERVTNEAEASGMQFAVNHGLLAKAVSLVGLRRFASAQQVLSRVMDRQRHESDRWTAANLAIQQARLQVSLGDLERAADFLLLDPARPTRASNEAEYDAYRALIDAARGREEQASEMAARSLVRSRNLEASAVAWIAQAVLAMRTSAVGELDTVSRFRATLQTKHHDAIVIGCRAEPELASRIAQDGAQSNALRAILLRSNDEPLARAAGLHVPRSTKRADSLSRREIEVYELMIQGRTNREIAKRLFITESTTKVHVRHILEKLGVRSRVEAVRAWRPAVPSDSGLDDTG